MSNTCIMFQGVLEFSPDLPFCLERSTKFRKPLRHLVWCFALKYLNGWRLDIFPRQAVLFFSLFLPLESILFSILNAWTSLVTIQFCSASHDCREGYFVSLLIALFTCRKQIWMVWCLRSANISHWSQGSLKVLLLFTSSHFIGRPN